MAAVQVLMSIVAIVISFIVGFCVYYVTSPLPKKERKQQLEEIMSYLINFVIFVWVGKILLNIKLFISDPLTVLAYPSNSHAFYVATLLIMINVGYKLWKHQLDAKRMLASFVPVFLVASFIYEFIDIVWQNNTYTWGYLGLLTGLLILYMLFYEKLSFIKLSYHLLLAWSVGKLILAMNLPFTAVFGYTVSTWYLILISILLVGLNIYNFRKKVSSWAE